MATIADNGVCEGLVNLVRRVSSDDSVKNAVGLRFMLQLHSFFAFHTDMVCDYGMHMVHISFCVCVFLGLSGFANIRIYQPRATV